MPRPFAFPLNIGTDICSIPRIFTILKGGNGRRFIRRVLNEREREEGLERLEAPVERWRRAVRAGFLLEWKREELGIGIKELNRRRQRALGMGVEVGRLGTKEGVRETEELRRELEMEVRAEELGRVQREEREERGAVQRVEVEENEGEGEGVLDEESFVVFGDEGTEVRKGEEMREIEGQEKKMEAAEGLKVKRLEDADIMIRLMNDNEKELAVAEEGLKKAAEFMAGRFAAKEAAIKAQHYRKLTYHSIAIHRPPLTDPKAGSQPPIAVILPDSGKWEDGEEVKISISHDTDYATAVCLAHDLRPTTPGRVSETNKEIFERLETDDIDSEEEEEDSVWKETISALEDKEKARAAMSDPQRLVKVENLAEDVTEEDLLELFRGRSEKLKVRIAVNSEGTRLGYGLVSLATLPDTVTAREKLDGSMLKGKRVVCRWLGNKKARTKGVGIGGKGLLRGAFTGRWVERVEK